MSFRSKFSFSSRSKSRSKSDNIGRAADNILDASLGRRLVHFNSLEVKAAAGQPSVDYGSCYLSIKLVNPADGQELKNEKVKGEKPGSGNAFPEVRFRK